MPSSIAYKVAHEFNSGIDFKFYQGFHESMFVSFVGKARFSFEGEALIYLESS